MTDEPISRTGFNESESMKNYVTLEKVSNSEIEHANTKIRQA